MLRLKAIGTFSTSNLSRTQGNLLPVHSSLVTSTEFIGAKLVLILIQCLSISVKYTNQRMNPCSLFTTSQMSELRSLSNILLKLTELIQSFQTIPFQLIQLIIFQVRISSGTTPIQTLRWSKHSALSLMVRTRQEGRRP
jgi:hypothetical protein